MTGPNSVWDQTGDVYVGYRGTGVLSISDGGAVVTAGVGSIGHVSLGDSRGSVTVTDPNSLWQITGAGSTWNTSAELYVGAAGRGVLEITDGGTVTTQSAIGGVESDSVGEIVVEGSGSTLEVEQQLLVGDYGNGSLSIIDGGYVSTATATIGSDTGGVGAVTVTGSGSLWENDGALYVGDAGQGELTISAGARVGSESVLIGSDSSGASQVTVTGTDSLLDLEAYVCVRSNGRLEITNGGTVTSLAGLVTSGAGDTCEVYVTGTGSLWDNTEGGFDVEGQEQFQVGGWGNSSLVVSDGGQLASLKARVKANSGGSAIIVVTGEGSLWTNAGYMVVGDFDPVPGMIYLYTQ